MNSTQPASLRVYFATEMWERYGFYVVQSLLALYMALQFKWPDSRVYMLVGSFTATTYLSPIIGGFIADKLLGQKITISIGAVCLFVSYISLSLIHTEIGLIAALSGIAVGTGLLKPNISSLLGNEYPPDSPQRDNGFTIFYMGITTGIIMGTTLPSVINTHLGWPASFASAALGMVIAFLVFITGIKRFRIKDYTEHRVTFLPVLQASLLILLIWCVAFYALYYPSVANVLFGLVVLLATSYLGLTIKNEPRDQARKTVVIALLCIISVIFWTFYFQMFLSWTLFLSRVVQPTIAGIPFPAPYYVGVQSIGMLIFGYFLSRYTPPLTTKPAGIRTTNKFFLSIIFIGLANLMFCAVTRFDNSSALLSPFLFIPAYLLIAIAELLLSPIGLSAITMLSGNNNVSTMVGIFFVSLGVGAFLAGKLASITAVDSAILSLIELKTHYSQAFGILFLLLLVAIVGCFFINLLIKKLLMDVNSNKK